MVQNNLFIKFYYTSEITHYYYITLNYYSICVAVVQLTPRTYSSSDIRIFQIAGLGADIEMNCKLFATNKNIHRWSSKQVNIKYCSIGHQLMSHDKCLLSNRTSFHFRSYLWDNNSYNNQWKLRIVIVIETSNFILNIFINYWMSLSKKVALL